MSRATRNRFFPVPPRLQSTDLSVTRPDPGLLERPEKGWERRQRAAEASATQGMALLAQLVAHTGGIASAVKSPPLNDVMVQAARTIGANGQDDVNFPEAFSAITIANLSAAMLSVGRSASSSSAPLVGAGVVRIPPGYSRTWPARDTQLKVFGAVGATYDLTAYSRPRPPAAGRCGRVLGAVVIPAGTTATDTVTLPAAQLEHIAAVLNVSAVTGSVQLTLNGVTPSGYVYPLLVGLAVSAVSVTPYRVGPGLEPSSNAVAQDLVPEQVQFVATVTGTAAYGVDLVAG